MGGHYRANPQEGWERVNNQIRMALEDKEKTTFITTWGTFCYKVMPFGLKNAVATYQRAMVTLFHDMMHKEVEVCVNDMIAKLNPAKCTFGVGTGKLLGFIVNERGIELDLDKVKAIRDMSAPKIETEVRGFLGRVNYIA
ncbi:Retrovirus-related Pol polyprotein, partial [Mucuna pruriens]